MTTTCNIPILNINFDDCIGDTAGKHNYNALVLDTAICNLSSDFYNTVNLETLFSDLSSVIDSYIDILPHYTDTETNEYLKASTVVTILSSIWGKNEFSVQYPVNGSDLFPDPTASNNIIVDPADPNITSPTVNAGLKVVITQLQSLAKSYLGTYFKPDNFIDGTIVNVVFVLYNTNPVNPDSKITELRNFEKFLKGNRKYNRSNQPHMTSNFSRSDVSLTRSVILKYTKTTTNNIKDWKYITILS
jgi:hypothetical protein